jgi:hypothetical protein
MPLLLLLNERLHRGFFGLLEGRERMLSDTRQLVKRVCGDLVGDMLALVCGPVNASVDHVCDHYCGVASLDARQSADAKLSM